VIVKMVVAPSVVVPVAILSARYGRSQSHA
jgi:hypothetical protein